MRIVVIGNGMVGSRFVADMCQRTEPNCAALSITVLGQEDCATYNRVLLTEVLAGAYDLNAISAPSNAGAISGDPFNADPRVRVLQGTSARAIDTTRQLVTDSNGNHHSYDALVIATGADARIPALPSLTSYITDNHITANHIATNHIATNYAEPGHALQAQPGRTPLAHTQPARTQPSRAGTVTSPPKASWSSAINTSHAHDNLTGETRLPAGTHVLRTIDDVRELRAAAANARRAIVLGAGVLGIETAVALAGTGCAADGCTGTGRAGAGRLDVTLVHPRGLMNAQLNPAAGTVAAERLEQLGVHVRTHLDVADLRLRNGHTTGLELADGERLDADLVVITTGIAPRVELGLAAGLAAQKGLLTDADSRCLDVANVYAIGDCAQPPTGGTGLVAQGWEQSRQLARYLATGESMMGESMVRESLAGVSAGAFGAPVGASGSAAGSGAAGISAAGETLEPAFETPNDVVKVKGKGVDIVAMGSKNAGELPGVRLIQMSDPAAGRYIELAVRNDRVIAATCVGAGSIAADLTSAYTRGTLAPTDPLSLLVKQVGPAASSQADSPVRIPDRATICRCNGVTKGAIVAAWRGGDTTVPEVASSTRATTGCGSCTDAVCGIVDWLNSSSQREPVAEGV